MPVLQVKTFRQKSGKVETSHYKVTVSRFRARMSIPINYNTLKGEMRVDGYPDVSALYRYYMHIANLHCISHTGTHCHEQRGRHQGHGSG